MERGQLVRNVLKLIRDPDHYAKQVEKLQNWKNNKRLWKEWQNRILEPLDTSTESSDSRISKERRIVTRDEVPLWLSRISSGCSSRSRSKPQNFIRVIDLSNFLPEEKIDIMMAPLGWLGHHDLLKMMRLGGKGFVEDVLGEAEVGVAPDSWGVCRRGNFFVSAIGPSGVGWVNVENLLAETERERNAPIYLGFK